MKYDPDIHHRRSIRLKGYDYSSPGAYFVTTVTRKRECLFGEVVEGSVHLSKMGGIVQQVWLDLRSLQAGTKEAQRYLNQSVKIEMVLE